MIVEKISDQEHTMRLQRLQLEICQVCNVLEDLADRGYILCTKSIVSHTIAIGDASVLCDSTSMFPVEDVTSILYESFGIDIAAVRREQEAQRKRRVSIHGEGS